MAILDYQMIIQIPNFAQGPVVIFSFRSTGVARLSDRTSTVSSGELVSSRGLPNPNLVYICIYIYIYMIFG